jgi:hypothetical protein
MADGAASGRPGSWARPSKTVLLEPLILSEAGLCDMDAEGRYSTTTEAIAAVQATRAARSSRRSLVSAST